jgi:hypothetical protein
VKFEQNTDAGDSHFGTLLVTLNQHLLLFLLRERQSYDTRESQPGVAFWCLHTNIPLSDHEEYVSSKVFLAYLQLLPFPSSLVPAVCPTDSYER